MELVLLLLLVFIVLGSLAALEMENLLSAVIAVGVAGLGLSIVFLLLGAPDIAITQVVVEVIVVTVLIRLTGRTERAEPKEPRQGLPTLAVGAVALIALAAFVVHAFGALPPFGSGAAAPSTWYLANAPTETGATNVVTAVLLDFRAYDTLGEATVILCAIVGAIVILRRPARKTAQPQQVEPPHAPATEPKQEVEHV